MSGAGGYVRRPISDSPLPSFAWQDAQWSAQCARASARTSGVSGTGFVLFMASAGTAAMRARRAIQRSAADGPPVR